MTRFELSEKSAARRGVWIYSFDRESDDRDRLLVGGYRIVGIKPYDVKGYFLDCSINRDVKAECPDIDLAYEVAHALALRHYHQNLQSQGPLNDKTRFGKPSTLETADTVEPMSLDCSDVFEIKPDVL